MTARRPIYEPDAALHFTHKGDAYVGRLVKAQRRAAVVMHRGRLLTVPWTAVRGQVDGKKHAPHAEGRMR